MSSPGPNETPDRVSEDGKALSDAPNAAGASLRRARAQSLAEGVAVLEAHLKTLPSSPGVYRMLNGSGDALYFGKARNLKRRVTS